jgi:hypothetical protein
MYGAPDPLFRKMLYNRGVTFASLGAILVIGGAVFMAMAAMRPATTPEQMAAQKSLDMPGLNQEDEFHQRVAELNAQSPAAAPSAAMIPVPLIAIAIGGVMIGVGAYQMHMARRG